MLSDKQSVALADLPDSDLIDLFIKSPLTTAKELLKRPGQKERFWKILEQNAANTRLAAAYKHVEQILGPTAPPPVQPQAAATPEIPEYKPAEESIEKPAQPVKKNPIGPENAKPLENWMNGIKPGFYQWWQEKYQNTKQGFSSIPRAYAASQNEAAVYQNQFTHGFLEYLSMYKGGLAGFYLSQGAHELLFSALGPVGEALAGLHQKDLQWKMAWMKNPLNANALYYWLNAMPEEQAFKLLYLPARAAWAILAGGGAPLVSKVTYTDWEYDPSTGSRQVAKTENFFSPTLKLSQAAHTLGNGLEKLTGLNDFDRERFESYADFTNWKFKSALDKLHEAKKNGENLQQARQDIRLLLNQHDGSVFRNAFHHTARRLKNTRQDPISYLVALIIGTIYEFTVGLILNTVRVAVGRAINTVPGVNTLRGQMVEFLTRSKLANIFRISNTTVGQFGRALVSPTSLSSGYLGAGAGGWVANTFGLPTLPGQVMGGSIGYGLGVFYKTSLNLANMGLVDPYGHLNPVGWTKQYEFYRGADVWRLDEGGRAWSKQMIGEKYYGGLKPGPINKFARWLYDNPYARLPINGFVIADIGVRLLGWNPWVAYPSLMAADWAWQTRATWGKALYQKIIIQPTWNIFGKHFVNNFSIYNPNSFAFRVRGFFGRAFYVGDAYSSALIERPWLNSLKNIWSKTKPYASTVFNPGFWMGFSLAPLLTPSLGGWAWVAGPAIGSATWMAGTRILAAVTGMPYARFASMFNPLAFTGFFIGQLTGLAFFGWNVPFWYTAAWTLGVPLIGMPFSIIASMAGISVPTLLGNIIAGITSNAISALAATSAISTALAAWATVMSVALVAGLTVFFAYTIYAGFWVPMNQEYFAKPESTNFSIKGNCTEVAPNKYRCCSNFTVTADIFSALNYLTHETDLNTKNNYLTIDLTYSPANNSPDEMAVSRDSKKLDYNLDVSYTAENADKPNQNRPDLLESNQYTIHSNQDQIIHDPTPVAFDTYLSTPDKILTNLFDLMSTNPSVVREMKPFWDILVTIAKQGDNDQLVAEYEAQQRLLEKQKDLLEDIIPKIEDGKLQDAKDILTNTYLNNNPLGDDPCPDNSACPEEKKELNRLWESWQPMVQGYIRQIDNYLQQTGPDLTSFVAKLKNELDTIIEQIKLIKQIIDQVDGIKINDKDAARILELEEQGKYLNFTRLPLNEREEIWNLLSKYFKEVFDKDREFYFVPQGTDYQVCVNVDYCAAPTPGDGGLALHCPKDQPQTICSIVRYSPGKFSPEVAFAKACTTFTPQ